VKLPAEASRCAAEQGARQKVCSFAQATNDITHARRYVHGARGSWIFCIR
jgi:hypothetical protein